jgi:serine/threonine-protein kinase
LDASVSSFIRSSRRSSKALDVAIGTAGSLLGCAILGEVLPPHLPEIEGALLSFGDALDARLRSAIHPLGAIGAEEEIRNLGAAHGWAGLLFAILRWRRARALPIDEWIVRRLGELASCAEPSGRGMRWAWREAADSPGDRALELDGGDVNYMAGWCNGSAGFVFLWLLAYELLESPEFLDLAEGAAWNAWEEGDESIASLCCGLTGRAYALHALYRATSHGPWLDRARNLAAEAAKCVQTEDAPSTSLHKGALGVALLCEELNAGTSVALPLFESEGWSRPLEPERRP